MIIVTIIALNGDDFATKTDVVPCDTMHTARLVVEKAIKDYMETFADEDDDFDEDEWRGEYVRRIDANGSVYLSGIDAGHGKILISEREETTTDTVGKLKDFSNMLNSIY